MRNRGTSLCALLAALALTGCASDVYVAEHPVNAAMPPLREGLYLQDQVDVKPVPTHEVEPEFPYALASIPTGKALVVFTVGIDGRVGETAVVSADDALFGSEALKAIAKWRFRPARLKGAPVACRMTALFFFDSPYGVIRQEGEPAELPSRGPDSGPGSGRVILR